MSCCVDIVGPKTSIGSCFSLVAEAGEGPEGAPPNLGFLVGVLIDDCLVKVIVRLFPKHASATGWDFAWSWLAV